MNSEPFRYHLCREIGVARAHAKETDQNPDDKCARLILDCSVERCWGDQHISEDAAERDSIYQEVDVDGQGQRQCMTVAVQRLLIEPCVRKRSLRSPLKAQLGKAVPSKRW